MEINSPPYAGKNCCPVALYNVLRDLHAWATSQREWANMKAKELDAPENPFVPDFYVAPGADPARYLTQSIPDMFVVWQAVRAIREQYDDVVRNYDSEEDWESNAAIYYRITAVKSAALLVSLAFMDSEKREAKIAEILKRKRDVQVRKVRKQQSDVPGLKELFGANRDDRGTGGDIDFDRLFHGDDADE